MRVKVLFLLFHSVLVLGASLPTASDEDCSKQKKCSQCIQLMGCSWCIDKNLTLESTRCFSSSSLPTKCASAENPIGSHQYAVESNSTDENSKIHPQLVELRLRQGAKINISIEYTNEKNRPLDMYIVMDLSCSMKRHKDTVVNLATTLAEYLKGLTSELRLGFGSFVDKPLAPFGFLAPPHSEKHQKQCGNEDVDSLPYGFKNHLTLTEADFLLHFIKKVNSTGISSNVDSPEGTLDGLLQSIVCRKQIGWRNEEGNRKLVVISTDGPFHLARDGKLVGVVEPHDGVCYVDAHGGYTHDTILDYPSISLLRRTIRENNVFVIFAVTEDQESAYSELSRYLHPFAVTQGIDNDNNSIISVIQEQYRKLVNTVTMLSEHEINQYIGIKFFVRCPGRNDYIEGNRCNEVGPGVKVSFIVEVALNICPSIRDLWNSNIKIYPQSAKDHSMTINLEMLCGCECEQEDSLTSNFCSRNGYLKCGICECDEKWTGPSCNCSIGNNNLNVINSCVDPKSGLICNNNGSCDSCGGCKCNEINGNPTALGGKYCQCDNTACPFEENTDIGLCNEAAGQGRCVCRRCKCHKGFNGVRCQCPLSNHTCRDIMSSDMICSGKGSCECGKCSCDLGYTGYFCEIEHARLNGSCKNSERATEECINCLVQSNALKVDMKKEHCKQSCANVNITFVERIGQIAVEETAHVCKFIKEDSAGCKIDFIIRGKYLIDNKRILETEKALVSEKCPTTPPVLEVILGIGGAMVLIGVVLLFMWKIITYVQDKHEYERFEKSINDASWDTTQNPLYQPTTSQFKNPVYADCSD